MTQKELTAIRKYRDILNKKEYTNAEITFLTEVNEDLNLPKPNP